MATFILKHNKHYEIPSNTEILELQAPGSNICISSLDNCKDLESINVDNSSHWYFNSLDGILYTRDMKELIRCPIAKRGTVVIPEGVEEIAYQAFYKCDIDKVVFPHTLRHIKTRAFSNCKNLQEICFGEGITSIGGYNSTSIFEYCPSLTHIEFPSQIKEIHMCSFGSCQNLRSVKLNDGLALIDRGVFSNCALEEIHIPDSVTKFGVNSLGGVKKVYASKYIPGMITAACCNFFYEGILEFHINDDVIYVPKHMTKEHINSVEDLFTHGYGERDVESLLCNYAVDTEVKQYVAFKAYQKNPTKSLETYLKRISRNLAETLIRKGKHDDFVTLLETNLLSDNALKYAFELVQGYAVLSAYVMEKMAKCKDINFSL